MVYWCLFFPFWPCKIISIILIKCNPDAKIEYFLLIWLSVAGRRLTTLDDHKSNHYLCSIAVSEPNPELLPFRTLLVFYWVQLCVLRFSNSNRPSKHLVQLSVDRSSNQDANKLILCPFRIMMRRTILTWISVIWIICWLLVHQTETASRRNDISRLFDFRKPIISY